MPLLGSAFQGEMLAGLYLHPEDEYTTSELARLCGVSTSTVSREADRLAASGLITERSRGRLRLLRANLDTPVTRPLTDLLAVTYGPKAVLGELLGQVDGVDEAYIYGSWAARFHGEPGPVPRDVDVLVIGEADDDVLFDLASQAARRLGREVNLHRMSPARWNQPADDPFLRSIHSRPLVSLDLPAESNDERS
jgi:predicted nucleotidyltransferase